MRPPKRKGAADTDDDDDDAYEPQARHVYIKEGETSALGPPIGVFMIACVLRIGSNEILSNMQIISTTSMLTLFNMRAMYRCKFGGETITSNRY